MTDIAGRRRKILGVSLFLGLVLIVSVVWVVGRCRNEGMVLTTYSDVAAIHRVLQDGEGQAVKEIESALESRWRLLSEREYAALGAAVNEALYVPRLADSRKTLLDQWGRRILIYAKRANSSEPVYIVVSKGRDGQLGTADDIISPYESVLPFLPDQ